MKTKDIPDKYNYLKSIKEKELTILTYYKKVSNLYNEKPKPLPKPKKRTKKNNSATIEDKENKEDKEDKEDKVLSIVEKEKENQKQNENEKRTKKNIVIMDD
jgi:hypothetical protein